MTVPAPHTSRARPLRTRYDALVVGGGHNGLVAAFYLARSGLKVAVLEARDRVGGVSAPIEVFPGYRGAITNTPSGLSPKVAREMDLASFGLRYSRPDPTMIFPFDDGRAFRGWRDPERTRQELAAFSRKDAVTYFEIIEFFTRVADKLDVSVLEEPPSLQSLISRLLTPEDEADFATVMFGSVREFLDARLESDEVKALLASLAMSAGNMGPATPGSPFGLLRRPLNTSRRAGQEGDVSRKYVHGGSTGLPFGGMGSVVEAMAAAAIAAGAELVTEAKVNRLLTRDGQIRGAVLVDGTEIHAGLVLSSLVPRTTLLDLLPADAVPEDLASALEGKKFKGGAFKLFLALDGIPEMAAAPHDEVETYASCQFRYSPSMDYLDRAYDDFRYGRFSARPKMLGLTPTIVDPTLAPPGKHMMSVSVWFAPYTLSDGDWEVRKHEFGRVCVDTMRSFVPNIEAIITDMRAFSPRDLEQEFGLLEGHQQHGDMTPGGMFGFRPHPSIARYRTPVRGLYLCGSGTWPGGTVTALPGHNAAMTVLSDLSAERSNADKVELESGT
ncbi:phytoene desaturase family protein [Actinomadura macra]|uniref:phytoene desaturase family protein n=1 Tax=Actinomadura macra TaxID=46164 RepID=UPI00082F181F|nr:NAD(P)/FAD-dependent oxidoreductase [Actinomadura macra]